MSTINVEKDGNTITLSGDMTNDFEQMKKECAGRYESMFGDAAKVIAKVPQRKMTQEQIMQVYNEGVTASFYDNNNIWAYFCVNPEDYSNYMFSPADGENRDNKYLRLRTGIVKFSLEAGFDVYKILCA